MNWCIPVPLVGRTITARIACVIALLLPLLTSSAETGCVEGNCVDGEGTFIFDEDWAGQRYAGFWKNKKREGRGSHYFADGYRYDGEWKADKRHGRGTYVNATGHSYSGEWLDDQPHGQGTFIHSGGNRYEGEWKQGVQDGLGTFEYSNGSKYHGEWKGGEQHGGERQFRNPHRIASRSNTPTRYAESLWYVTSPFGDPACNHASYGMEHITTTMRLANRYREREVCLPRRAFESHGKNRLQC